MKHPILIDNPVARAPNITIITTPEPTDNAMTKVPNITIIGSQEDINILIFCDDIDGFMHDHCIPAIQQYRNTTITQYREAICVLWFAGCGLQCSRA